MAPRQIDRLFQQVQYLYPPTPVIGMPSMTIYTISMQVAMHAHIVKMTHIYIHSEWKFHQR